MRANLGARLPAQSTTQYHITMNQDKHIIIDFDTTFLQVDHFEELAEIVLKGNPEKAEILKALRKITDNRLDGKISYNEALSQRIALVPATQADLDKLAKRLKKHISDSFSRNTAFFKQFEGRVYLLSKGFREYLEPLAKSYHIGPQNVLANEFTFDEQGRISGFENKNHLAHGNGKVRAIKSLGLSGNIIVIGDALTGAKIKDAGISHTFFTLTDNDLGKVEAGIAEHADHVIHSFDEFLYVNKMPMSISFPKNRIKVLILENIHKKAETTFTTEGYQVETVSSALSEEELCERIKDVSIIGIRSKTNITRKVLEHSNRLMVVGAFCIGTNQIDLEACAEHGVIAFNAPYSNTRSVVELAIGEMIMLMRRIPLMNEGMHVGKWDKSAKNSFEIRGKRLGIVGYGNIGSQLSVLAESLGMEVYYYDIVERLALGNAKKCHSLPELLRKVDVVSLHVDGRAENKMIFGEQEIRQMRDGAILLNLSRGFVVEIEALVKHLKSGKLQGAAVDVYPSEPKNNEETFVSELRGLDNVILTPHIGGSTLEAQENIADYVPARIIDYINSGSSFGSVNFPNIQLPSLTNAHRLIHIHKNVPGILARINNILAEHKINILGQHLKTNEQIGYVITDIDKAYDEHVLDALKDIPHTIKFRVLY